MEIERFKKARDKAGAFLVTRQHPDGSYDVSEAGVGKYFGVPIALQVSGHSKAASRLLHWVRTNAMKPRGGLRTKAAGGRPLLPLRLPHTLAPG